jgi:hypothetical protein
MADDRLEELKHKLAASERMGSGYKDRIEALKLQIADLEGGDQTIAGEGKQG